MAELKKNEQERERENGCGIESEFIRLTVRKIIPKLITAAGRGEAMTVAMVTRRGYEN